MGADEKDFQVVRFTVSKDSCKGWQNNRNYARTKKSMVKNEQKLTGKVALVTGGASGIGKAISLRFAENGAVVHILDLNGEQAEQTAAFIRSGSGVAWAHACDVSVHTEMVALMSHIHQEFPIDILVNNAGIGFVGKLEDTTEADFDRLYRVNVKGVYNGMFACIPHMKTRGSGVILNMASIVSSVGIPDRFAYSMTKGAVLTMTLSVAMDYIGHNIRCNCISPARIHTPFVDDFLAKNYPGKEKKVFEKLSKTQPLGRMGTPAEVANLALFLCSDEAAFITGCDFPVDGGFIRLRP
jgi:NAD(P)-dependent dehydrogenase (short-subunit alcohol dehydrogenase family)